VNLFWQAVDQPMTDYIAFVQLLDAAGQVAAGWEAPPGGTYATSAWQPGTLMRTQAAFRPRATCPMAATADRGAVPRGRQVAAADGR